MPTRALILRAVDRHIARADQRILVRLVALGMIGRGLIDAAADVIHVRTIVVSLDRQTPRDHRMPGHVVGVLRHQLPRRFDHRVDVDRRHRLNPDSASRDHVRATHRHVHHHPVT